MQKVSEVYEKLYHYTNWDGLVGILQSKTLWATHCKFLNDYSEIVFFRNKLISLLIPHVREACEELIKQIPSIEQYIKQMGGLDQVVKHETEVIVDAQYGATGDEIYILSFCGQHENPYINSNGLLSQWRGYGTGGGFALIFNTQKIEEMLNIEAKEYEYSSMHFCDLVYSDDENKLKDELSEDLSIIASNVKKLIIGVATKKMDNILKDLESSYQPFVRCISRYKHYGFKEENEIRVVVLPTVITQELLKLASRDSVTSKPEKERKFRNKNGQFVPYVELFKSIDELPIERIIVGPHKEKEARVSALRVMLRNAKIEITCSDIPFAG
jgi:hypothetical protein